MEELKIQYCPGSLAEGYDTYSRTVLNRVFGGRKVSHVLPYDSPFSDEMTDELFEENQSRLSISGVQRKYSVVLEKNRLRLISEGEQGQYILKPVPGAGKNPEQMPANEHLTMQIARQVFRIKTAENALVFFKNGDPAYITKRFDVSEKGEKLGQEDFASLAGRTPQTHGENYKYDGNCFQLFELLKKYVPAYAVEAPQLFKVLLFNYLISNGDAHYKNFSVLETAMGDFRFSPAYDLLNSRIHIDDRDFAMTAGLLPKKYAVGKVREQFYMLGDLAEIPRSVVDKIMDLMTSKQDQVIQLIHNSYFSDRMKRNYEQAYLTRLNKLMRS